MSGKFELALMTNGRTSLCNSFFLETGNAAEGVLSNWVFLPVKPTISGA
jgi:hypothetical protein